MYILYSKNSLTSQYMGTNVPPHFQNSSLKIISIDSQWLMSRDWISLELRYWGYFRHFKDTFF